MRTSPVGSLPLVALAALSALPATAAGQAGRLVDVGSFTITVDGRTLGRESFRLTATTRGDQTVYLATSDITYGDRSIEPRLTTDGSGTAVEYQVRVRSGDTEESWKGGITRNRLIAEIVGKRGTAAREQAVPARIVIVDDDVMFQHWVLGLRVSEQRVSVLVPRRDNARATWTVSVVGEERLRIGTEDIASTHLRATGVGGDVREVWLDRSGRLLKVSIPSRSLLAVRDDPPAG